MRIKTECLNLFQIISFQLNLAIKNHGMSNTLEPPTENTYISHKITTRTKKGVCRKYNYLKKIKKKSHSQLPKNLSVAIKNATHY